jgi:hypothetical protein
LKDLTKARKRAENQEGLEPHPFVKSRIEKNNLIIFESIRSPDFTAPPAE